LTATCSQKLGIPQGSPVSSILFLIYIRNLFDVRFLRTSIIPSYVDDIAITATSNSAQRNCAVLKLIAEKLIRNGNWQAIGFDMKKTELIHFHTKRTELLESLTLQNGTEMVEIAAKDTVKWLGIWFDRKLNFKEHVEKRIASAYRAFCSIQRLSNTARGLSFKAMRQLYISCVSTMADYGIPIWWNQQKNLEEKFNKLQNAALRKILAFGTTPTGPMEIEAALPPAIVRFEKVCKNYAVRVLQLQPNHPIRLRLTNFRTQNTPSPVEVTELPKARATQLSRIMGCIGNVRAGFFRLEKFCLKKDSPWREISNICTSIPPSTPDKDAVASDHMKLLVTLQNEQSLIYYTDGSKFEDEATGAGYHRISNFLNSGTETRSKSWFLGQVWRS
jgi:Reverse transcriptase (RNA-dependent DNA polymerase)